jgi:hypothetical protein
VCGRTFQGATAFQYLIEYMEAPFRGSANDNSALLEKVPVNVRACDAPVWSKANAHKLAEPTRVVVSLRLRVAERLENGIGLKNLAL